MADDNEQSPPPPPGGHDLDKTGWTPETPAPPAPPVTHDLERTGYIPEAQVAPQALGADKALAVDDEIDNKYRIEELLGQGGMGAVYRVTELQTRERLALKTLNPELRGNPAAMADLAKEVATARQLSHEHLLRVYSMEAQGEFPYLVMEYVGGGDLDIRRKAMGGALAPDEAATRMVEVLGALGYLHNRSFVHRDVKPQNVLLTEAGHAKVTDFGISTSLKQASTAAVGTPRYMAPEQISGGEVTLKADIYAAGMMFYQLLTGTFPYGSGPEVTLEKVKAWHMAPTSLPDAPAPWRAVLEKAMARESAARFKTAQEMADAITAVVVGSQQPESAPAASNNKGALVAAGVVVAGLLGYIGLQGDDGPPPPRPEPTQAVAPAPTQAVAPAPTQAVAPAPKNRKQRASAPTKPAFTPNDIRWISLPGGIFSMGSSAHEKSEAPPHTAKVKAFSMMTSEATVEAYQACIKAGSCSPPDTSEMLPKRLMYCTLKDDRPRAAMNCAAWSDAKRFCAWAGGQLPTEEQWEYAARGTGKGGLYPWGNKPDWGCDKSVIALGKSANTGLKAGKRACGTDRVAKVCSKPMGTTPEGICDLAGNLWEWTVGCEQANYSAQEDCNSSKRMVRGGGFWSNAVQTRSTRRKAYESTPHMDVGIRCVK